MKKAILIAAMLALAGPVWAQGTAEDLTARLREDFGDDKHVAFFVFGLCPSVCGKALLFRYDLNPFAAMPHPGSGGAARQFGSRSEQLSCSAHRAAKPKKKLPT